MLNASVPRYRHREDSPGNDKRLIKVLKHTYGVAWAHACRAERVDLRRGSNPGVPHREQSPPSKRETSVVQYWRTHDCLHDIGIKVGIKDALSNP